MLLRYWSWSSLEWITLDFAFGETPGAKAKMRKRKLEIEEKLKRNKRATAIQFAIVKSWRPEDQDEVKEREY